jgi:hypothetical protein
MLGTNEYEREIRGLCDKETEAMKMIKSMSIPNLDEGPVWPAKRIASEVLRRSGKHRGDRRDSQSYEMQKRPRLAIQVIGRKYRVDTWYPYQGSQYFPVDGQPSGQA